MAIYNHFHSSESYAETNQFHSRIGYGYSQSYRNAAQVWCIKTVPTREESRLPKTTSEVARSFRILAEKWREETSASPTMLQEVNDTYLDIIGLGPEAIPHILKDLDRTSDHWFIALKAIAKVDPVQPPDRGNIRKMKDAWLDWGRQQGYID